MPPPRRRFRQRANSIWNKRQRAFCAVIRRKSGLFLLGVSVLVFGLFLKFFSQAMAWLDPIHFYRPFAAPEPDKVGDVVWRHCTGAHVERAECGHIVVPLDYGRPDVGLARIALARYNATSSSRKGTLIVNPGGPGSSGTRLATELGPLMHSLVGPEWDIVGFDPRGTGASEPRVRCFPKGVGYALFGANTVLDGGYEIPADPRSPGARESLLAQFVRANVLTKTQFDMCERTMGYIPKYMGTTAVARDIDFITTVLEGRGALINFYGISYGSVMAQYLINMFPDRVGRVALDGIVDGPTWSGQPVYKWFRQELRATERTWQVFLDGCFKAGTTACALARSTDVGSADIAKRVDDLLARLYVRPLGSAASDRAGLLTSGRLRHYIFSGLLRPRLWPDVARGLAAALAGDAAPILSYVLRGPTLWKELEVEAVACNDVPPSSPTLKEDAIVDEYLHVFQNVSRFGLGHHSTAGAECMHWPYIPPERYTGPWNKPLRNPILILSNTADPVTPLDSGKEVHKLLGHSSRLVIQDSPGHVTIALASLCTARVIRTYFAEGMLPPSGTICAADEFPFNPDETPEPPLTLAEATLLDHLKALGRGLHGHAHSTEAPKRRLS